MVVVVEVHYARVVVWSVAVVFVVVVVETCQGFMIAVVMVEMLKFNGVFTNVTIILAPVIVVMMRRLMLKGSVASQPLESGAVGLD